MISAKLAALALAVLATGACRGGPCRGAGLEPVPVEELDGLVVLSMKD